MLNTAMQPPLLAMLHAQHRYYTSELGITHRKLGKEYEKLARFELELIQRHEKHLTRQEKKKLQWSRSLAKSAVRALEYRQTWFQDYLLQCNNLIASCESSMYNVPSTPWTAFSPSEPFSPVQWPANPSTTFQPQQYREPQYWDLSMLRERRESSPFAPSADSGFHEAIFPGWAYNQDFVDPFSTATEPGTYVTAAHVTPSSKKSSISSGKDDVPDLREPISPTQPGASSHRRRYSENAIQLIENRLSLPKQTSHKRGKSESAPPVPHRTLSAHTAIA